MPIASCLRFATAVALLLGGGCKTPDCVDQPGAHTCGWSGLTTSRLSLLGDMTVQLTIDDPLLVQNILTLGADLSLVGAGRTVPLPGLALIDKGDDMVSGRRFELPLRAEHVAGIVDTSAGAAVTVSLIIDAGGRTMKTPGFVVAGLPLTAPQQLTNAPTTMTWSGFWLQQSALQITMFDSEKTDAAYLHVLQLDAAMKTITDVPGSPVKAVDSAACRGAMAKDAVIAACTYSTAPPLASIFRLLRPTGSPVAPVPFVSGQVQPEVMKLAATPLGSLFVFSDASGVATAWDTSQGPTQLWTSQIATQGKDVIALAAGDLDGDGWTDVVTFTNPAGPLRVQVFLGHGKSRSAMDIESAPLELQASDALSRLLTARLAKLDPSVLTIRGAWITALVGSHQPQLVLLTTNSKNSAMGMWIAYLPTDARAAGMLTLPVLPPGPLSDAAQDLLAAELTSYQDRTLLLLSTGKRMKNQQATEAASFFYQVQEQ